MRTSIRSTAIATAPAAGDEWVTDGPHVMVFPEEKLDASTYPTDPKSGGPYLMWAGTPYAHLMIPVP